MSTASPAPAVVIEPEPHPSPAQLAAWNALWRWLLAPPDPEDTATPAGDTAPNRSPRAGAERDDWRDGSRERPHDGV
jgi:hypothetical protein